MKGRVFPGSRVSPSIKPGRADPAQCVAGVASPQGMVLGIETSQRPRSGRGSWVVAGSRAHPPLLCRMSAKQHRVRASPSSWQTLGGGSWCRAETWQWDMSHKLGSGSCHHPPQQQVRATPHSSSSCVPFLCSQPYIVCRQCPEYRRQAGQPLPCPGPGSEPGAPQAPSEAPSTSTSVTTGETATPSLLSQPLGMWAAFLLAPLCSSLPTSSGPTTFYSPFLLIPVLG